MTEPEIDLFFNILNQKCIEHLFSGVHFVVNSMIKTNPNYQNFYLNFNYKNNADAVEFDSTNNCGIINYNKYINSSKHVNANTIQTLFYDFNNTPRLFIPNRLEHSTVCKENTELDKTIFTKKIIETYSNPEKTEIENILLINAWNEWGEKMHIEPSNENNFYYLEKLEKYINFHNSYKNYTTLFHKYTLKIASPYNEITYSLINEKNIDNQNITHLHIYDLNTYNEYISYICVLKHDFHIIITYIVGDANIVDDFITVIKCDNIGADIGPKICVLD